MKTWKTVILTIFNNAPKIFREVRSFDFELATLHIKSLPFFGNRENASSLLTKYVLCSGNKINRSYFAPSQVDFFLTKAIQQLWRGKKRKGQDAQCGNCKNLLSFFFQKIRKINIPIVLWLHTIYLSISYFHEIFFKWE